MLYSKTFTPRNFLVWLFAVCVLTMGLSFASQISSAPPASANSCSASVPCMGLSVDLAVRGVSAGSGNIAKPGGGGSSAPSAPPQKCFGAGKCGPAYKAGATWLPYTEAFKDKVRTGVSNAVCPPKNIGGYTIAPEGKIQVNLEVLKGVVKSPSGSLIYIWGAPQVSFTCVYPPGPSETERNVKCIVGYSAYFDRSANSYLGTSARLKTISQTVSNANSVIANPANCKRSISAAMNYSPPTNRAAWGQYTASSNVQVINCAFATTTFQGASTNIGRCSGAYTVPGSTSRLTIWCNGFTPGHVQKDWSAEDCYTPGLYSCSIPNKATYNGKVGLVQAIRDGNNSPLQWGAPSTSAGISGMRNWESKTTINGGSTPYNHERGPNDRAKQHFFSDNVSFGGWQAGQRLTQNLAFYTAGSSGSPFSMTRLYRYDAEFLTRSANIGSYNIMTGAITTTPTQVWITDTDVLCGPQGSPRIEVIRAIGDAVR